MISVLKLTSNVGHDVNVVNPLKHSVLYMNHLFSIENYAFSPHRVHTNVRSFHMIMALTSNSLTKQV
jgi:hypothetical protein